MFTYKYNGKTYKYDYDTFKLGRVTTLPWLTEFDYSTHILPEIWEDKERLNKFIDTWRVVIDNDMDACLKNYLIKKGEC